MGKFEAFDPDLKGMMGHHYQERPAKKAAKKAPKYASGSSEITWLKTCLKRSWVFSALSVLVFYWQQAGLMDPAAAVPSIYVCAVMFGFTVGKCFSERR